MAELIRRKACGWPVFQVSRASITMIMGGKCETDKNEVTAGGGVPNGRCHDHNRLKGDWRGEEIRRWQARPRGIL